jgi:hypothetical protein
MGSALLNSFYNNNLSVHTILGYTHQNRPVEVYYFPGVSNHRALIIGGMHGSERSSIEIAMQVISALSHGAAPYYNVIIIPRLFPDNEALAGSVPRKGETNLGRYSSEMSADPNRQMPDLGKAFDPERPMDFCEREIEKENQWLLHLIQEFKPSRIINLHAIKDVTKAGIYADPRTDCHGTALGFATDSLLAVSMARLIAGKGGDVPGNELINQPTALYYHDPEIAPVGTMQIRNLHGSSLPYNRGCGVSLGGWATTAVCEGEKSRPAIRLITVEFPGYQTCTDYPSKERSRCTLNSQLYVKAITSLFLSNYLTE